MTPLPLGLSFDSPEPAYRADLGINQSTLKAFGWAPSPQHFKDRQDHLKEETAELRIGRWVDCAIFKAHLAPNLFASWHGERKGNAWKEFREQHNQKTILNGDEMDRAFGCLAALNNHEDTQRILQASRTQVAAVGIHPKGYRLKGLIDILPDPTRCDWLLTTYAFDLKTSADASPEEFARSCWKFGYDIQAAFYMELLNLCGVKVTTFAFIVVENIAPHAIKIYYLPRGSKVIERARNKIEDWLPRYVECRDSNRYPGYTSDWNEIEFAPWMLKDS